MHGNKSNSLESFPYENWGPARKRLEYLKPHCQKEKLVLDAGCGTGWATCWLMKEGYRVISADLSDISLSKATNLLQSEDNRAMLVKSSLTHLPFQEDTFKTVFCFDVLEHIPNYQLAIVELSRVASRDGRIILTVPNKWGLYSIVNDCLSDRIYLPMRSLIKRLLKGQWSDYIEKRNRLVPPHVNFQTYRNWIQMLERGGLLLERSINLEFAGPILSKFGYMRTSRLSFIDTRLADYLPYFIASEWILICRKKKTLDSVRFSYGKNRESAFSEAIP